MIEIICVIWLLNQNGKIAIARGQNPSKYRVITLGLWFGLEVLGTIAGTLIALTFAPNSKPLMIAYAFGITGALLGALLSRVIVNRAPLGNYKPQNPFNIMEIWQIMRHMDMEILIRQQILRRTS